MSVIQKKQFSTNIPKEFQPSFTIDPLVYLLTNSIENLGLYHPNKYSTILQQSFSQQTKKIT